MKCLALHQVSVKLIKAFDTANRATLWTILAKLGSSPQFNLSSCLSKFITLWKLFLSSVGLCWNQCPSNRIQQSNFATPTLSPIFFAVNILHDFQYCDTGFYIRFRIISKVFVGKRFNAKSKTSQVLFREPLYADDVVLGSHTEEDTTQAILYLSLEFTLLLDYP